MHFKFLSSWSFLKSRRLWDVINIISSTYLDWWSNESSRRNLAEKPANFAGCQLLYTTLYVLHKQTDAMFTQGFKFLSPWHILTRQAINVAGKTWQRRWWTSPAAGCYIQPCLWIEHSRLTLAGDIMLCSWVRHYSHRGTWLIYRLYLSRNLGLNKYYITSIPGHKVLPKYRHQWSLIFHSDN